MKNYANFGRRFVAVFIDGLLIGAVNFIATNIFGVGVVARTSYSYQPSSFSALPFLVTLLIGWGYYVYFIGSRGQTIGKMAMNIKVMNANGKGHPDYMHAFLREIVGKFISGLVLGLGYFWMLWDDKKQTWHDKIAGTVVVRA